MVSKIVFYLQKLFIYAITWFWKRPWNQHHFYHYCTGNSRYSWCPTYCYRSWNQIPKFPVSWLAGVERGRGRETLFLLLRWPTGWQARRIEFQRPHHLCRKHLSQQLKEVNDTFYLTHIWTSNVGATCRKNINISHSLLISLPELLGLIFCM